MVLLGFTFFAYVFLVLGRMSYTPLGTYLLLHLECGGRLICCNVLHAFITYSHHVAPYVIIHRSPTVLIYTSYLMIYIFYRSYWTEAKVSTRCWWWRLVNHTATATTATTIITATPTAICRFRDIKDRKFWSCQKTTTTATTATTTTTTATIGASFRIATYLPLATYYSYIAMVRL